MPNLPSNLEPKPILWRRLFLNPYGNYEYLFDVGMSPTTLEERLKQDTAGLFSISAFARSKPFGGDVRSGSFELNWLKKSYRNSWSPVAIGSIEPYGKRTKVKIRFRVHPLVSGFLLVWMTFPLCLLFVPAGDGALPLRLVPFVFLAFATLMVCVGVILGRNDQRMILNYFAQLPDTALLERHDT